MEKLCSKCKQVKDISCFWRKGKGLGSWCKECSNASGRASYKKKPWVYNARSLRWREKNKEKYRETHLVWYRKLREDAINHYGGKCQCCGEKRIQFLAIDHINNDGNEHRKLIGNNKRIEKWLKDNNYPEGFQILCHNCNMAKSFYGKCPHQEERKEKII